MQYVKCGFAGENFPTSVFPCVVGRPMLRYEESLMEQDLKVNVSLYPYSKTDNVKEFTCIYRQLGSSSWRKKI